MSAMNISYECGLIYLINYQINDEEELTRDINTNNMFMTVDVYYYIGF